jgi:hypothetical protein
MKSFETKKMKIILISGIILSSLVCISMLVKSGSSSRDSELLALSANTWTDLENNQAIYELRLNSAAQTNGAFRTLGFRCSEVGSHAAHRIFFTTDVAFSEPHESLRGRLMLPKVNKEYLLNGQVSALSASSGILILDDLSFYEFITYDDEFTLEIANTHQRETQATVKYSPQEFARGLQQLKTVCAQ